MELIPGLFVGNDGRQCLQVFSGHGARDGLAGQWVPGAARLAVNHFAVLVAKREPTLTEPAVVHPGRDAGFVVRNDNRPVTDEVIDHRVPTKSVKAPCLRISGVDKTQYKPLGLAIELAAVFPTGSAERDDRTFRMSVTPGLPVRHHRRDLLQLLALQWAVHRFAQDVTPQTVGFRVVHHQAAVPQHPGDTERQRLAIHASGIHDAIVAEVSPRGCDWPVAERIVVSHRWEAFLAIFTGFPMDTLVRLFGVDRVSRTQQTVVDSFFMQRFRRRRAIVWPRVAGWPFATCFVKLAAAGRVTGGGESVLAYHDESSFY